MKSNYIAPAIYEFYAKTCEVLCDSYVIDATNPFDSNTEEVW